MFKRVTLLLLFHLSFFSQFVFSQDNKPQLISYWDKGVHFDSQDNKFKIKLGGRIQQQWSFFGQDEKIDSAFGLSANGAEFRRIRLYSIGTIYHSVNYKFQLDFTGGIVKLNDAYITLTNLPIVGNLRLGHFKEPFGLDQMNSSNDMTFIERTTSFDFTPHRNNGILLFNTIVNKRATWALGVYKDTDGFGKTMPEDKYNLTGRITALPLFNSEKKRLLHIGIAYSYRSQQKNIYNLKSKPEAHLAPTMLDIGTINNVNNNQLLGLELAFVAKSFSVQAEYIRSMVNTTATLGKLNFSSSYIEFGYFISGESRKYSRKTGNFSRNSPTHNFSPKEKGSGAWQIAMRFSNANYNSGLVKGGILNNYTAGLNWYLNPITLFAVNYTYAQLINVGNSHITQLKFQITF